MTDQQAEQATQATPSSEAGAEGAAPSQEASTQQPTRTVEQVEAEWQSRHTALGRQHAAEVASLKAQLETAQKAERQDTSGTSDAGNEVEALKRQLAEAQKAQQQQAQQYTAELRKTKYPYAADALDPEMLATMDEAKLAGLEARLKPSRPGMPVDPNTPQGGKQAPKPMEEKSAKELKADLARMGAGFAAELRNR